jgi:hypothetical protein
VCLTKRLATEKYYGGSSPLGLSWNNRDERVLLRFPSTATFASAPFRFMLANRAARDEDLRQWIARWLGELTELHGKKLLDFTPPGNLLEGMGDLGRESELLRQEGTWFYDLSYVPLSAWRSHFSKDPSDREDLHRISAPLKDASNALREIRRITGVGVSEYYAIIVLDGDDMGKWKAGRHRCSPTYRELGARIPERDDGKRPVHPALYTELSRRLALLNDDLHHTVAAHLGRLVYHGGDDVLAFVPLATALPCLAAIRRVIRAPEHLGHKVTVSAGLSITHWKEPLSGALHEARAAEKCAKHAGKDRMGISLNPRSGEQISLVLPWRYRSADTAQDAAAEDETIALLQKLLGANEPKGTEAESPRLTSGKAAYTLRDELPALRRCKLREAFLHRAKRLLFEDAKDELATQTTSLLEHLSPQAIINLLLLLRFLSRQQHGIKPDELLRAVKEKFAQPAPKDRNSDWGAP